MDRLKGKIALVTGAGTGIGKAIAIDLVEAGACVLTCGRRKELLEQTLSELLSRTCMHEGVM